MISGHIFRVAGLVVTATLMAVGPAAAQAQIIQVPQTQPPTDTFAPQFTPEGQTAPDVQPPAFESQQPALSTQPLAPGAQQPDLGGQPPPANTQPAPDVQTEPAPTHISNPVAVFAGLDKITGRIINFDVYINETVQFGALQVTPRVCYTRPPTEEPRTDAFVEVDEITLNRKIQRIFTGWMFASNPGLHAVDNAVYDVWLTNCKMKSNVPPPSARNNATSSPSPKKQ